MDFRVIDHNVNIIAMEKDGHQYAMCCAWVCHASEDKLMCFIGHQSATGNNIRKGDFVGVSNLAKGQERIAFSIGDLKRHSPDSDKLNGIDYYIDEGALLIRGAKCEAKCKVIDVLHINGLDDENVIYLQILRAKDNEGRSLHMSDLMH